MECRSVRCAKGRQVWIACIRSAAFVGIYAFATALCGASLIKTPNNTAVFVGQRMEMECRTNNASIIRKWLFLPTGSNSPQPIASIDNRNVAMAPNVFGLGVDVNYNGSVLLYSNSTETKDAGVYICQGETGSTEFKYNAELIVLESEPICEINLTASISRSNGNYIWMQCRVNFAGNWAPSMEWRKHSSNGDDNEGRLISTETVTVVIQNSSISSTAIVTFDSTKYNTYFSCRTYFAWPSFKLKTNATNVPDFNHTWNTTNHMTSTDKFCDKDNDTEYSITWARTVSGKTDFQPCTRTTNGSCSRKCLENNGGTADWAKPNCNGCFDTEFVDLLAKVTNVEKSVLKNETTKIAKQLSSVTNKSEGLTSGNLNASVMLINRLAVLQQNSTLIPNANEIKSIVQATSNVLRENNTKGWEELEVVNNTLASAILFSIDVYGRSLSALNKSSHTREEAENLVLEAWSLPKLDRPANIEFPNRSSWDANSGDGILFSIGALEKSISSESWKDLRMWGSYYRTVAEYLPGNKKATSEVVGEIVLQSRVISFTVDGLKTDGKLESPVTITLKHNQEKNSSYKRICSFWNFTRSEWDSEGCLLVSTNSTHTVCRCDHLTNFAILMSLNPHHDDTVLSRISVIGLSISVAALILTILVYALTWKHSKSAQATVLLNLCVALTIAYIIFLTGADKIESSFKENDSSPKSPPTGGCTAVAILLHYFFLAAFFIMLIEGVELLLYIIFVFHVRRTRETIMLIASAWFLPLIIVGVSLGVTKLDGYGHDKACWLSTKKGLIWAFIAPVLTIIVANFVILIIVLRWMTKQKSKLAKNAKKRDDIRATIWNLSVTCPVLGLGWFFGFLSVSFESVVFQYLFVIANSLQGVLIFIFHALFHNKKMNEKISSVYSNYICRCRKADLSISTQSTSSQDQTGKKPPKKSSARKSAKPNHGKYDVSQSAGTELTSFNESEAPEPAQTVESTQESQQTVESTQKSQQTVESTDKTTSTPQDEKPNEGTDRKYSLQSTGAETTSFEDSESARLITSPKLQPPSKTGEEPFVPKAVKYYEDIAKKDQPVGAGTTLSAIIDSEALVSTL